MGALEGLLALRKGRLDLGQLVQARASCTAASSSRLATRTPAWPWALGYQRAGVPPASQGVRYACPSWIREPWQLLKT